MEKYMVEYSQPIPVKNPKKAGELLKPVFQIETI